MQTLEKLQRLGMAASYDSCGGGKEKSFREYGIPYEYQNFIHNCTQSTENVFVNSMMRPKYKAQKGKNLYERKELDSNQLKEIRNKMTMLSPKTENEKLNKANKCLLVKVLQDNSCVHDCKYCLNSACKKTTKTSLEPNELATSFEYLWKRGYTTGLFLSSAVHESPENSTEKMIASARLLRERGYTGYIHMKVLPETPEYLIKEMALYANRLSVNVESATTQGMQELSNTKNYKEGILRRINSLDKIKRDADKQRTSFGNSSSCWFCDTNEVRNGYDYRFKSFTTQLIIGANEETDKEVLERMNSLYSETSLYRTYFSAFAPVKDTPLQNKNPESKVREHRLYEVDWLLRIYGFDKKTISLGLSEKGNFSLGCDVKQSIAIANKQLFPLDLNSCTREELLLVPGFGPKTVDKIIEVREQKKIKELQDLIKVGVRINKAKSYLNIEGKQTNLLSY